MHTKKRFPVSIKIVLFLIGCSLCIFLQEIFSAPAVLASACVGFGGSFLPRIQKVSAADVQGCIYSGSFLAMGPSFLQLSHVQIFFLCTFSALIYFYLSPHIRGMGGRLGLIALLATTLNFLAQWSFA